MDNKKKIYILGGLTVGLAVGALFQYFNRSENKYKNFLIAESIEEFNISIQSYFDSNKDKSKVLHFEK